jgi:hypothetical protein
MKTVPALLLALTYSVSLYAQSVTIAPGDPCFAAPAQVWPTPSMEWTAGVPLVCTLANMAPGDYQITYLFREPTVTAPGQRIFAAAVNGMSTQALDLYAMGKLATVAVVQRYYLGPGVLTAPSLVFTFTATVRNPVVSLISVLQIPGSTSGVGATGPQGVPGPQGIAGVAGPAGGPGVGTTAGGLPVTLIADLPAPCGPGDFRFVPDSTTAAGAWPLWLCEGTPPVWIQLGLQGDGTGLMMVNCFNGGACLVGPNTALAPFAPPAN